ncbi:MAG TPA: 6-carboxytetrahydropterin synthase [Thermoanaerobaculia bacterium]|nr:6-carboxytetrahydropterin synthase [Thermoanaerobaculia bacterium]
MPLILERTYRFSASHLYRRPEWSEEENRRRFGLCANLPGHGHNYRLTLEVAGSPHTDTGFLVDLGELDRVVRERVLDRIDHRHLNEAIDRFASGREIPTSENVVRWIVEQIAGAIPGGAELVSLRLAEDEDLAARWTRGDAAAHPVA